MRILQLLCLSLAIIVGIYFFTEKKVDHPVSLEAHISTFKDPYLRQVQPILNNKCVACHSCFNSPCQLDLTSFEGMSRGAHKYNLYDFPNLEAAKPTRLGIDEINTIGWRKRDFWSVTERRKGKSILDLVLAPVDSKIFEDHEYLPEEKKSCVSLEEDLRFFHKNPRGHMPYGFPDLTHKEHNIITRWLDQGAKSPSESEEKQLRSSFHSEGHKILVTWEEYLNQKSFKSRLRSRYIYEHLFFGLLSFDVLPGEHYRLVRAKNNIGDPQEIATSKPFDNPGDKFFYRFKKNIRTVMDKTNLPYVLNDKKLDRWKELFDKPDLLPGQDKFPAYGDEGSNAFATFKRIHPRQRYQFLLDDAYYHIMNFIKGPVCRGPTALNVINDHFWLVFRDPSDKTLDNTELQKVFAKKMFPPSSAEDKLESFDNFKKGFWNSLKAKYDIYEKEKISMGVDSVWDGGTEKNPSAFLTIFRHNDSAEVLKGAHGEMPKTVWMLDYQVFEDIYYNLVAGYNVYGPIIHQVNTRLYMEISRISSEDLFLTLLNSKKRSIVRSSWSQESPNDNKSFGQKFVEVFAGSADDKMTFKYPFLGDKISNKNDLDTVADAMKALPFSIEDGLNHGKKTDELREEVRKFTARHGEFVKYFPDATLVLLKGKLFTLVRNKFHYNVSMMFFEDNREEPAKDTLNLVSGSATSYPNLYLIINDNPKKFSETLAAIKTDKDYGEFLKKYGVSRKDVNFWNKNERFVEAAFKLQGAEAGRFDLSRYIQ